MDAPLDQSRQVYRSGDAGVTLPETLTLVNPEYTKAALAAHIQGKVILEAVVKADGSVGNISVPESLDQEYGLDAQAIAAARQYAFKPGVRDGEPVAVAVSLEFNFTLR